MSDQFDDYAPAWRPIEGETLEGVVRAIDSRETEYGVYPIVTIETDDGGAHAVHAFHSTLKSKLIKARPAVDERITIQYQGERRSKSSDRSYHAYRLHTEHSPATSWDDFEAPPPRYGPSDAPVAPDIPTDLPWSPDYDPAA